MMAHFFKAIRLAAAVLLATSFASVVSAQEWPPHNLRILVPFPAGGSADIQARAIADELSKKLGKPVLVENKPGAGGNIAFEQVANATPDGRQLVLATNSLVINPLLYPTARFDAQKSFAPVAMLATSPVLVLGRPDLPFKTFADLLTYAKQNPGKLSYASCGNGGIHHLAAETLKATAGVNLLHVAYKGCSAAMIDLAGGQVDLGFISLTSAASFIDGKRVAAFAVTRDKPSPFTPGVPTIASASPALKSYSFDGWYALLAPAGTPPATVQRLNEAINRSLGDAEVKKTLANGYLDPAPGTPASLGALIASEDQRYGQIIKAENIKGD